jgi:hypothetical protein
MRTEEAIVGESQLPATITQKVAPLTKWLPTIALIGLFGFASVDKLLHFWRFVYALHSYRLVPVKFEIAIAVFIILTEFLIALGLLFHKWRRISALLALVLLALFTIVYLIAAPEDLCGCWFSFTLSKGGTWHVVQNAVFAGLAIFIWLDSRQQGAAP